MKEDKYYDKLQITPLKSRVFGFYTLKFQNMNFTL